MAGLSNSTNGLWGSRTGLASSTSLSTPPSVLADVYSPSALFATNEIGTWYDPSDLTTLFQDSAGTSAVTAPAQTVGVMLDKSKQQTFSTRINRFNYSEQFDNTTSWARSGTVSVTANTTVAPDGTTTADTIAFPANLDRLTQTVSGLSSSATYVYSVYLLGTAGQTVNIELGSATATITLTGAWQRATVTNTGSTSYAALIIRRSTTATSVIAWGAQLDLGSVATVYQPTTTLPVAWQGNHAIASGTTRPIYAIVPKTGRRNLLTNTPFAGAVSGSPGTNPTSWGGGLFAGTRTLTLSGETLRLVVNGETNINQTISVAANTNYIFSIKVNVTTASQVQEHIRLSSGPAGSTLSYTIDGSVVSASTTVPTGEHIIASRLAVGATAGTAQARFGCGFDGFSRVCDIVFSEPQAETGTSRTNYQRVVSAYEVTEAGVPSLSYLSFDGVDDFMVTGTITPGTDKAQVFAGVRKLSDAARGVLVELSTTTANLGTFGIDAPAGATATYGFGLSGSTTGAFIIGSGYTSPITSVLACSYDIAGTSLATEIVPRINGATFTPSSSGGGAGTGNFLAYPLYIGRRGGTTLPFNGYLFGLITRFGPNLSSALITQTEQWLNTKTQAF